MKKTDNSIGVGIIDIFKGLGSLLETVQKMNARGCNELSKVSEFGSSGTKGLKGAYGFRIRVGGLGEHTVQSFGNLQTNDGKCEFVESWEPIVDVFDEGNCILVVVELPGVDSDHLQLDVVNGFLIIKASGPRYYSREVALPCAVDEDKTRSVFKNGILEITLYKAK